LVFSLTGEGKAENKQNKQHAINANELTSASAVALDAAPNCLRGFADLSISAQTEQPALASSWARASGWACAALMIPSLSQRHSGTSARAQPAAGSMSWPECAKAKTAGWREIIKKHAKHTSAIALLSARLLFMINRGELRMFFPSLIDNGVHPDYTMNHGNFQ
jgi:hypothetical protein